MCGIRMHGLCEIQGACGCRSNVSSITLFCVPYWEYCSQGINFTSPLPRPREEYCEIRSFPTASLLGYLFSNMVRVVACHAGDPGSIATRVMGFSS